MLTISIFYIFAIILATFFAGVTIGVVLGWRTAVWRIMTENEDQFATISDTIQDS